MAPNPKDRAFAKGVILALGTMEMVGDLFPPKKSNTSKADAFKNVCPTCADATSVFQSYGCENGHGPFPAGECHKARETDDGKLVKIDAAAIEEVKSVGAPKDYLEINVHARDEMAAKTVHNGMSYVFKPQGSGKLYGVMCALLAKRSDLVFVGQIKLRGNDKLMEVEIGLNGQLILAELVYPEDVRDFEAPNIGTMDPRLLDTAEWIADNMAVPYDPANYTKQSRAKLAEVTADAAKAGGAVKKGAKKAVAAKVQSDDDALLASLEAMKAELDKKKAAKPVVKAVAKKATAVRKAS